MALDTYLGDLPLWGDEEAKGILESLCTEFQVEELVQMQREYQDKERAAGSYERISEILDRLE
mgnify:CR=1 FL=1